MNEDIFHLGIKALIRDQGGKILVLQKNPLRPGKRHNPPHWDLPGGRLKKGDDIAATLRKELKEELNINNLKILDLFDTSISTFRVYENENNFGLILVTFLCHLKNPQNIKIMDDEHSSYKWCLPKQAAKLLQVKFGKSFVEKIKDLK